MSELQKNARDFPVKTPNNAVEEKLIKLQAESDLIGFRLYEQVVEANFGTEEQEAMGILRDIAEEKLASNTPFNEWAVLEARYFYNRDLRRDGKMELVYPVDSLHYTAYIEGKVISVKPLLLEHPAPDRNGELGYRLCAEIEATRVAGWTASPHKPSATIYAPIGEISTDRVSYDQGMAEALQPNPYPL